MKTQVKELQTAAKMTQQQLADLVHTIPPLCLRIVWQKFGVSVEKLCYLRENRELEDRQYENL